MIRWTLVALGGITTLGAAPPAGQSVPEVAVRAFRFYRAEARQTLVTAFLEVPYQLLEADESGPNGHLRYGVTVRVTDTAGLTLHEAAWPGRATSGLRAVGASKLEILDFAVAPGRYGIGVTVTDSVSGRQFTTEMAVEGWSHAPLLSDLLLSPGMRLATEGDTVPSAGEMRRGNTMVMPAAILKLTPRRSKAFYLVEAYTGAADSGTMQVRVVDSAGRALVTTRPVMVRVASGGSVLRGQVDLAGLPSGEYVLTVEVVVGGHTEERSGRLFMADFVETLEREQAVLEARKVADEGYFGLMTEDQLNEAAAPLVYLVGSSSLSVWKGGLSVTAKRQFLARFWSERDPTPGTPRNEAREAFYAKIAQANKAYTEAGVRSTPGWRTDRGRIFTKHGPPGDMLDRRTSSGKAPPYQVWRYASGKSIYYIFADRSGFGGYQLLATNDLRETSSPSFRDVLGAEALQDISRWLGIDLTILGTDRQ
jgi:GWxTD domain-containing protein